VKHLFSPEGQEALRRLAGMRVLFAFDFDGTLAPIVGQPNAARISTGLRRRLAGLARQSPVVVISGRSFADLRARLPTEVLHCIGNHGNEGPDLDHDATALHDVCAAWLRQLQGPLADPSTDRGISLEDKGITLSLHYRMARDRAAAAKWLEGLVGALAPTPRVIGGKCVLNLLPPGARTKFEALVDISTQTQVDQVFFVGDDDTDEIVFAQAPHNWITVRVDFNSASRAAFFVRAQSEVAALLDRLLMLPEA
jgi:trehalose 6-phosphate phosphatase